ncbi:MAG: caspase family protein [Chitinophagaceae bacterium]|nr:caspase family protein [Chitinophagaceae bacterium]
MLRRSFYIFTFCFFLLGTSFAQPGERGLIVKKDTAAITGNTYAIIIGISDYKVVPDLQYAHKDAQAFEDFLLTEAGGKVPKANIETFLNDNATRNNVGDAISVIARKAKPGDRVWFFFAGHGDMEDLTQIENGLLLLYNSPNGNYFGMNDDVLEILDLKRYLSPLSQKGIEMIFIVDACHSGNLTGGVEGVKQTGSALMSSWGREYKILSCQPDQLSLESSEYGGGRGLFSLQLEEGMKGLADADGNGKITMFELQSYIQTNVAKYSEYKQIPMVSGDLSKSFFKVDPLILTALKKQKAENYPMLALANTKGNEDKYIDSLDPAGKKIYFSFKQNLDAKKLIWPKDTNALRDYRAFVKKYKDNPLITTMRRTLAASLNERFNGIVGPLLKGQTSYSTRSECYYAAMELDSCLNLLGDQHYMYTNLKARKLYMDAMALTWALSDNEYNFGWKETVQKSITLLEESATLESNAAYTLSALGISYLFLFEFEKANQVFQKYIDLRPNDYYAKFSLGLIYAKLKQFDKAEDLFETLLKIDPDNLSVKLQLCEIYENNNKPQKSLAISDRLIASPGEKTYGYFTKGTIYSRQNRLDSAVYYYQQSKKYYEGYCIVCDNNIGHIYFVNNELDSAKKYFRQVLAYDSTYPFANFNLGTIELIEDSIKEGVNHLYKCWEKSNAKLEGFVTNLQLYFGKTYPAADKNSLKEFSRKSYTFNMQYMSLMSMLYAYFRTPNLINNTENINLIFDQLLNFKEYDMLTWYHHACYSALKQDTKTALESLGKSLSLGFGSYFQVAYDADLDFIRNTTEFKALLQKYFPEEPRK